LEFIELDFFKNCLFLLGYYTELVGISSRKVEENIKKLKDKQIIERVGANRGGYWRIMDEELWN